MLGASTSTQLYTVLYKETNFKQFISEVEAARFESIADNPIAAAYIATS